MMVLLPVRESLDVVSPTVKVLLKISVPDHTHTFLIGIDIVPEVLGLRYHSVMVALRHHARSSSPLCSATEIVGRYARLAPLF